METFVIIAAGALCLFALWAISRHDLRRLTGQTRKVMARVTGHRASYSDSAKTFAAVYSFSDETGAHEVIDQVYGPTAHPPVGTMIELSYPAGHPQLARPPRPLMWIVVYAGLLYGLGVLIAKGLGLIDG